MNPGHYLNEEQLKAYLYYGYVPQPKVVNIERLLERYNINLKEDKTQENLETLIEKGSKILDNIFKDIADKVGGNTVVIPLSGGMDSRAVLAGVLSYLPKDKLETVTVGVPGTMDYDIGKQVANRAGVSNTSINLNKIKWKEGDLIEYAKIFNSPISLIEGYLYKQVFCFYQADSVFLSGFEGDPIAGSKVKDKESASWQDAKNHFIYHARYTENTNPKDNIDLLPYKSMISRSLISYSEQLYFCVRRRFFMKPLVLLKNTNNINVFLNSCWIEFMFNLPKKFRLNQFFYKKLLLYKYPDLFSLPLKNTRGVPLNASTIEFNFKRIENKLKSLGRKNAPFFFRSPAPQINYIDFEQAYKKKEDLKLLAEKSLNDLTNREIVNHIVDIKEVWKEHQSGKSDHSNLISLLVSLEIFLKAKEIKINEKQY